MPQNDAKINTDIGLRIKHRRTELNMSQKELAVKIGYKSRSSINKIELGERSLTQQKIKAIADALDTTPSYIMGWEDGQKANVLRAKKSPTVEELKIKIDSLTDANVSKLLELCNLYLASQDSN